MNAAMAGTRAVGLDIGGTKTHGGVLGEDGSIVAQVREVTRPGADGVVATAERVFEALVRESGGSGESLACRIGVGVPGLVVDGRLRRGEHGAAGEIGHVPVDPHGAPCGCGQTGCLETIASGRALALAWPTPDGPPAAALFAAAAAGDPVAVATRDRFCWGVASAIRALGLTIDPERIVLGGGVAEVGEPLREQVVRQLRSLGEGSPFLASLGLADRLSMVPLHYPVAAVGAAILGR